MDSLHLEPHPIQVRGTRVGFSPAHVMGVLNVTPDSFSDGGTFVSPTIAAEHAIAQFDVGATWVDIGGESTRPGADPVSDAIEIARVLPTIQAIRNNHTGYLSIDTRKATVAEAALDAGADCINDVSAFADPAMAALAADRGIPVILMHMRGAPKTMQAGEIVYDDVLDTLRAFFAARIEHALAAGVDESQIILDPGIGFGKTVAHNFTILRRLGELRALGRPILLGTSRKSFIGAELGHPPDQRDWGTAATIALGREHGASILRVHNVGAMIDVLRVTERIIGAE